MKYFFTLLIISLLSIQTYSGNFLEEVKIEGFICDQGKVQIHMRSLQQDRVLYLAKNNQGDPEFLEVSNQNCKKLIKNLGQIFTGEIHLLDFKTSQFSRTESVYIKSHNPCEPFNTKKCDFGYFKDKTFTYLLTETYLEGYSFFNEKKNI